MATTVLQYGAQWLVDQVTKLDAEARKQEQVVRNSRARVNALRAGAEKLTDARQRVTVRASVASLDARQRKIESLWNGFVAKYKSMRDAAVGWMRANGLLKGTGLGELGIVQLAPMAIVAAVLAVWGVVAAIKTWNEPHLKSIAAQEQALRMVSEGKITNDQYTAAVSASARAADSAAPKGDPLGLASLADSLVPLGLIVLGIVVAPRLLRELEHRRTRKAVAA